MILYKENLKTSSHVGKSLLEIINSARVQDSKINIQQPIWILYTCNEQSENEINTTIQFTIASIRIKYLGINLTEEMQILWSEKYRKYKTVLKEI